MFTPQLFNEFTLKVSDIHTLHVEECGNPNGNPVLFLHGGPGGGISESDRIYFDPAVYRIVLFDQRGAGKSTPHASLVENDTFSLVSDIEKIRLHLSIPSWIVFGGSWGSTLSLVYAQEHPKHVKALILRGIFMLRKKELDFFYQEGKSEIFADYYDEYSTFIPVEERDDLVKAYYKRLTGDDKEVQLKAARSWSRWEMATSKLRVTESMLAKAEDDQFSLAFARVECHYFINKGFFKTDQHILENCHKLRDIPMTIVQGRLKKALPHAELIITTAGHSATEPETRDELIKAAEKYKNL